MSLPDQVIKHYSNASGVRLVRGQIVRAAAGVRQATTALADTAANVVGVLGTVEGGGASINGGFNIAITGNTRVLLETGLVTPAGGDRIFISATTAGRGTNVAPATEVEIGVIADASRYAIDETVEATLYGAFAPGNGGGGALLDVQLMADQLDVPNNAAWTGSTGIPAPTITDANDNDIKVAAYDDSTEEGRGFDFLLPLTAMSIDFTWISRGDGSSGVVRPKMYFKAYPDGAAPDANFTAFPAFANIDMPASANFVYDTENMTIADIGLTANRFYNVELTRDVAVIGYVGDWFLKMLRIVVNA